RRGEGPGQMVDITRPSRKLRRAALLAGVRRPTRVRGPIRIGPGEARERSLRPPCRDRHVDDAGIDGATLLVGETKSIDRARFEILNQDVGPVNEIPTLLGAARLRVEEDTALVEHQRRVVGARPALHWLLTGRRV